MPSGVYKRISKKVRVNCDLCKTDFLVHRCRIGRVKYCSKDCWKASGCFSRKGLETSENHKRKISQRAKERVVDGRHNFWQGGKTDENHKIHNSIEYKLWRTAVFVRDGFRCVWCKIKGGWSKALKKDIRLNADHIKPFAYFPELRFVVENGRTLCLDCHRKTDTWGKRALKHKPIIN